MATELANLRTLHPSDRHKIITGQVDGQVYIGRRRDGRHHYGNPFTHDPSAKKGGDLIVVPTRHDAVQCFEDWMTQGGRNDIALPWHGHEPERREWIWKHLQDLWDKTLWCWCYPEECHGDWYVSMVETIEAHGNEVFEMGGDE